jgi:hypothetical protein
MDTPAIDNPASNVWVIDPKRHNGHRLGEAVSLSDILEDTAEERTPSYEPVDMAEALTAEPVVPAIGSRADGRCLLYRRKTHWVYGGFESAKSWLAMFFAAQVLSAGNRVCYVDYEDSAGEVGHRLLLLGAPHHALVDPQRFVYIHPERPLSLEAERQAFDDLLAQKFDFAVLDGVTEAMSLEGLSSNLSEDVAAWQHLAPNALASRTGAAVVCIDHIPKDKNNQGGAIGSQHKLSGVTGAAYVLDVKDPFGKGLQGRSMVRVRKDRPGGVRGLLGSDYRSSDRTHLVAEFVVDARSPRQLKVDLYEPHVRVQGSDRPTWCMEQASLYIESDLELSERSQRRITEQLWDNVKGGNGKIGRDTWRDALDCLVAEGYANQVAGPRNSKVYRSLRRYRQANDPQADAYDENAPTPEELEVIADRDRVVQLQHKRERELQKAKQIEEQLTALNQTDSEQGTPA